MIGRVNGFVTCLLGFLIALTGCDEQSNQNQAAHSPIAADLILQNGAIYTVNPAVEWTEAIAIKDGRIIAMGSNEDVAIHKFAETDVWDLDGRMAMPGLVDTHVHVELTARDSQLCILPGTFENPNENDLISALKMCDERFQDHDILFGYRFATSAIPDGHMNRQWLDAVIADRAVIIRDESGHNVLLNTMALAMTDIAKDTPSPPGGVIHRDVKGDATGYLQSSARQHVEQLSRRQALSKDELMLGWKWAMQELTRNGVTAAMNATTRREHLPYWKSVLTQNSFVPPRMHLCHWVGDNTAPIPPAVDLHAIWLEQEFPPDVKECAKIYGDNVLEAGQAGLLDDYALWDHPGRMNFDEEEFAELVAEFDSAGIQIKTHAIGDRTNRTVLNAYERVIRNRGSNPLRHHLAHLTVVHPDDWGRLQELDVPGEVIGAVSALIPYVQASYYRTLGHERFEERVHPIGGIVQAGGIVNASSDWGAGVLDPFRSIQTVITRKDPNNLETPAAGIQHAVDLPTAIRLHTINGQYLLNRDEETGTLEVGKLADLIVIDQNLFEIPVNEIRETKVLLTLIGGKIAYSQEDFLRGVQR